MTGIEQRYVEPYLEPIPSDLGDLGIIGTIDLNGYKPYREFMNLLQEDVRRFQEEQMRKNNRAWIKLKDLIIDN